jgi:hypothetical protein
MLRGLARVATVAVALAMTGACGCAPNGRQPPPLDRIVAQKALETVLTAWKNGRRPESLREERPPIVVGEPDWEQGWHLISHRAGKTSWDDGSNQYVEMVLTLRKDAGAPMERTVTYVISTSPVITVIRE